MVHWQVEVAIFDPFQNSFSEEWLRRVALLALASEEAKMAGTNGRPVSLSLVIADDETLRTLKREYLGEDEATDVLSFPFLFPGAEAPASGGEPSFVVPQELEGLPLQLGEVIVSYPQAVRQAQTAGHSPQREVALLVAHGVLHLMGYDHAAPEEEAVMWKKQEEVLQRLFSPEAP